VAARCANDKVKERFMFMFNRYQDMINRWKTTDLSESQPTKGNIAGGLTTIEEKALGNIQKIGKKYGLEWAEAYHYIGNPVSTLTDYIEKNAVDK
jgi:altronate dehydratase